MGELERERKDPKLGKSPFDQSVDEAVAAMKAREDPSIHGIVETVFRGLTESVKARGILPPEVFLPVVEGNAQRTTPSQAEFGHRAIESADIEAQETE